MAHRIVWCCLLVFAWLAARGELGSVRAALANPVTRRRLMASAVFISINWLLYVWAVNNDHVVDASLGYFINPLFNVVLGVFVLHERLNRAQWIAVGLAAIGVLYLAVVAGRPPWIALTLAATFGMYGLIRKVVAVDSVPGLATETLLLSPLALGFLVWAEQHGTGALGHSSAGINALLIGSGLITALPLDAVCVRCTADPAVDRRARAVHRPDAAVPDRRAGVPRAVPSRARRRLRADLVGARDLRDGQLVAQPVQKIGDIHRFFGTCGKSVNVPYFPCSLSVPNSTSPTG